MTFIIQKSEFFLASKEKTLVFKSFPVNIMLIAGIEPATSSLPWMRSANWAKSAYLESILQLEKLVKFP